MQSTGLAVGLAQLNSRQLGGLARPYIRGCGGILSVQKTPFSHAGQAMPSLLALAPNAAPQAAQPSGRPMRSADLPAVLALNQVRLICGAQCNLGHDLIICQSLCSTTPPKMS